MLLRIILVIVIIFEVPSMLKANNPTSFNFSFYDLTIYGCSNFCNFSFVLDNNSIHNENIIVEKNDSTTEFLIPVYLLKTQNKFIQHDFLKMIKADVFPYIKFTLGNDQMNLVITGKNCDSIKATITIAEESRHITTPIIKGKIQDNIQNIIGKVDLLLTDFNLVPLSKIFGLVKVENEVKINFKINFISS